MESIDGCFVLSKRFQRATVQTLDVTTMLAKGPIKELELVLPIFLQVLPRCAISALLLRRYAF